MWKQTKKFTYTGNLQKFTLNPGKYLVICKGAKGGKGLATHVNLGGTTYGVLNPTNTVTLYAAVGGNGGSNERKDWSTTRGKGGYNGGGDGGKASRYDNYNGGAGGGGATDIRLSNAPMSHEETRKYDGGIWGYELEYVESDGTQWFDTAFIPSTSTKIELVCEIPETASGDYCCLFGTYDNYVSVYYKYNGVQKIYVGYGTSFSATGKSFPTGRKIKIIYNKNVLSWYGMDGSLIDSVSVSNTPRGVMHPLFIFNNNNKDQSKTITVEINKDVDYYRLDSRPDDFDPTIYYKYTTDPETGKPKYVHGTASESWDQHPWFACKYERVKNEPSPFDPEYYYKLNSDDKYVPGEVGEKWSDHHWYKKVYSEMKNIDVPMDNAYAPGKFYYMKMYEDDELIRWYIPVSSRGDIPLHLDTYIYDLVRGISCANPRNYNREVVNPWIHGPHVEEEFKSEYTYTVYDSEPFYTRIIVAGGGGGGQNVTQSPSNPQIRDFLGYGGGCTGGSYTKSNNDAYDTNIASQTDGYSFGRGSSAINKKTKTEVGRYGAAIGISGAGGGWYGGYTCDHEDPVENYTSTNGGGGSGYILTEESYKPVGYMEGYGDYSDLYFTDIFMSAGTAEESCVIICEEVGLYEPGDRIIAECTGEGCRLPLIRGNYTVECFGGDGAFYGKIDNIRRGGYAIGTFTNPTNQDVFAYVGGSGFPIFSGETVESTFPYAGFNGGGRCIIQETEGYDTDRVAMVMSGGGTDLRIGEDSYLARIIVAGGSGGQGGLTNSAGAGGGTTGGTVSGGSGYNGGPGTQTQPGTHQNYPEICGGFGYGGNGTFYGDGYGGAGGGGWYGGSGTKADTSRDDDKCGAGGSGFIYTNGITVPAGYKLDSNYCLTGAILTQGGNTLPPGVTKLIINVNSTTAIPMIAQDFSGYKYFNQNNQRWERLVDVTYDDLTPELFEEYGVYDYDTDEGLADSYSIIFYDADNMVNTTKLYVVPPLQTITTTYYTRRALSKIVIDMDLDEDTTTFTLDHQHKGVGEDSRVDFVMKCNMTDVPEKDFRLYCIYGYSTQGGFEYHEPIEPKPPVKPKQYLLHVGTGSTFPSRYKLYMRGFIYEHTPVEVIGAACTEANRNIYTATMCNNVLIRLTKLNLISNTSTQIKDIVKENLGGYPIGDIKVDDNYIYMTPAQNDSNRYIYRTSLDPNDPTVSRYLHGTSSYDAFNAMGRMEWLDDTHIIIAYHRGFTVFDTVTLTYSDLVSTNLNGTSRDIAIGKKYGIIIPTGNTKNAYVCELATNTWSQLSDAGIAFDGAYLNACCYGDDGNFYITQRNTIYIIDETTLTLKSKVITPYTSLDPKSIMYANHNLFIIIQNNQLAYVYDTQNDKFVATSIPFQVDNWDGNSWTRGCAFQGYMFLPNAKLFVINFTEFAKYDMGYINDQFMMATNAVNVEDQPYVYDDRFVSFTPDYLWIHPGYITKEMMVFGNDVKYVSFEKSEYNKCLGIIVTRSAEPTIPE